MESEDQYYGNQDCVLYRDFRELLERADIDAVLIATGDRWHALASILAAKAGKDVYSEKPCCLTIGLCQALDDVIKSRGLPAANSKVMRRSHTACHAAALAWILQRKLKFDPAKEEFLDDDEANGLRARPAREPWTVSSVLEV